MPESAIYRDKGSGRIRPVSHPTYRMIFALPDGTDFVLQSLLNEEQAAHIPGGDGSAGVYSTGHTLNGDLRENWGNAITPDKLDERAADTMFYVLPEGYTDDVTTDDSVLSAEQIASEMLVEFREAISDAAEHRRGAIEVFRDVIAATVARARKGYVRKPF